MTKVGIKNFQSIKNVEFSIEGFTVVIGKNNIGKSAVIRAVDAALSNQAGNEYIRYGEKTAEVKINHNGLDIDWKKGDTATYIVNGEPFTKLNRAVPQPILDAGFRKIDLGDQKVSPLYASQFEPLFLLDKTGSVVTEVISRLYKLNVISSADFKCQRILRSSKSMLKTRELDMKNLQKNIEGFKDFDSLKLEIKALAEKEKSCNELKEQIRELSSYDLQLRELEGKVKVLEQAMVVEPPKIGSCEKTLEEFNWLGQKGREATVSMNLVKNLIPIQNVKIPEPDIFEDLTKETLQVENWDEESKGFIKLLRQYKEVLQNVSIEGIKTDPLESLFSDLKTISGYEENFMVVVKGTRDTRDTLKKTSEEYESALLEEKVEKEKIKTCPLCERPL